MEKNNRVRRCGKKNTTTIGHVSRSVAPPLPPRLGGAEVFPSGLGAEQIIGRRGVNRWDKERIKATTNKSATTKFESRYPQSAFFESYLACIFLFLCGHSKRLANRSPGTCLHESIDLACRVMQNHRISATAQSNPVSGDVLLILWLAVGFLVGRGSVPELVAEKSASMWRRKSMSPTIISSSATILSDIVHSYSSTPISFLYFCSL